MSRITSKVPLEVIMIPLDHKRNVEHRAFPSFPRLYLELLENKDKIKKEFVKQEFLPNYETPQVVFDNDGDERAPLPPMKSSIKPSMKSLNPIEKFSTKVSSSDKTSSKTSSSDKVLSKTSEKSDKTSSKDSKKDSEKTSIDDITPDILFDDLDVFPEPKESSGNPLDDFLKKSRSIGSRGHENSVEKKASYDRTKDDILRNDIPPSLQDIEDGGAFESGGIKNASNISKREQDNEAKLREYLFKYTLLRKSYPAEDIPKFTINSDPEFVAKTYDDILRNLSLTDNINKYKKYLMFGFMGVESLVGNVLGFDMKGFTKQQIVEMSSYEKLIIELGEKNYVPKSNWPVELRLLGMIIMNAAFFIASKMALRATGTDVLGNMNTAASAGVAAANIQQRKKQRMSGPSINLDDIPENEPKAPDSNEKVQFVNR